MRDQRSWVQGDPKIQIALNDKLYYFAGIRQRDIFVAGPERYLPILDGDSIVAFAEKGLRSSGDLEFGLMYRDRLYFFRSAAELSEFQTQPAKYVNTDLVDQGYCAVSKIDEQKLVPGLPETVLTLDGLRYYFASALHRKVFAANPQRYVDATDATSQELQVHSGLDMEVKGNQRLSTNSVNSGSGTHDGMIAKKSSTENDSEQSEADLYSRPAVSGYCPVSIRKQGVWIRGKNKYKASFDGKLYHMAGTEELTLFRDNPAEFIPVLGGDSIVAFADKSLRIAGSAYQPVIAGGRLFLFADATEKQTFKDNPTIYENADLALQGNCIVTLVEEQREALGLPAFEAIFMGLRYRFVSQEMKDRFLVEPEIYVDHSAVDQ